MYVAKWSFPFLFKTILSLFINHSNWHPNHNDGFKSAITIVHACRAKKLLCDSLEVKSVLQSTVLKKVLCPTHCTDLNNTI